MLLMGTHVFFMEICENYPRIIIKYSFLTNLLSFGKFKLLQTNAVIMANASQFDLSVRLQSIIYGFLKKIKALTALLGQLSLRVGWENSPEQGQDCFI